MDRRKKVIEASEIALIELDKVIRQKINLVEFNQPKRNAGKTKNNFFTLYDIGMLGVIKHSRAPIRFVTFLGFFLVYFQF